MQESTNVPHDAVASTAPAAGSGGVAAEAETTSGSQNTTAPTVTTAPTRATQQAGRKIQVHPLWLAAAVAALFGLVFGLGAVARGAGTQTSSAPSGTTIEQTTIDAIQRVDPSVVQVQARAAGVGGGGGVGSGEILTTSGYIVTNDHVVHGFSSITVLLANGLRRPAQLVGEAPTEDLAVLKISASNLKPIVVGNSNEVQVGQYALAVGSPLGLEQSATSGIISALNRQATTTVDGAVVTMAGLIQTSAPINPGNSGGALVNLRGELIGIPTLGAVEPGSGAAANGIGFAITSNRMRTIVRQLTRGAA